MKRKFLFAFVLVSLMVLSQGIMKGGVPAPNMSWFGDGSASTFYIGTADELAGLAQYMKEAADRFFEDKTIELTDDIDLSDYDDSWMFSGTSSGTCYGWMPIGWNGTSGYGGYGFGGTFDGKGHTISNLYCYIDIPAGSNGFGGLFGYLIETGKVYNLRLVNVNVESEANRIGGLSGYSYGPAVIENVYVEGTVKGGAYVGGIVGAFGSTGTESGTINNCHADVDVVGTAATVSTRIAQVGGILGGLGNGGGKMSNCYVTGTVTGVENVGGLVGAGAVGNFTNSISNSVALNKSVKASVGPVGRVSGILNGPYTNNAALATMTTDGGIAFSGANTADGINGEDITMEEILSGDGTIGGRFTEDNGWIVKPGKLPVLFKSTTGIPNHPVKKSIQAIRTSFGVEIKLDEPSKIEIYNAGGQLIDRTTTSGTYSCNLANGVYIIRVNEKVVKFVK